MDRTKLISRIWTLAGKAGIDKDNLYEVVFSVTGSESISALNDLDLQRVIEAILKMYPNLRFPPSPVNGGVRKKRINRNIKGENVIALMTPGQKKYILDLIQKINSKSNSKGEIKEDSFPMKMYNKPFRLLTSKEARGVLEALISIEKRNR